MAFTQQSAAWHRPYLLLASSLPSALRPTIRPGATTATGQRGNMPCGSVARSFRYRSLPNEIPTDRPYSDPEKAARRLMEHAQALTSRMAGTISRRPVSVRRQGDARRGIPRRAGAGDRSRLGCDARIRDIREIHPGRCRAVRVKARCPFISPPYEYEHQRDGRHNSTAPQQSVLQGARMPVRRHESQPDFRNAHSV